MSPRRNLKHPLLLPPPYLSFPKSLFSFQPHFLFRKFLFLSLLHSPCLVVKVERGHNRVQQTKFHIDCYRGVKPKQASELSSLPDSQTAAGDKRREAGRPRPFKEPLCLFPGDVLRTDWLNESVEGHQGQTEVVLKALRNNIPLPHSIAWAMCILKQPFKSHPPSWANASLADTLRNLKKGPPLRVQDPTHITGSRRWHGLSLAEED